MNVKELSEEQKRQIIVDHLMDLGDVGPISHPSAIRHVEFLETLSLDEKVTWILENE